MRRTTRGGEERKEEEIYASNYLPWVFLRYSVKLARDAILPTILLFFFEYFRLWEKFVLNGEYKTISTTLESILPPIIVKNQLAEGMISWMTSETFLVVLMSVIVHDMIYIPQNIIYTIIDYFNLFPQYKISRNQNIPPPSYSLILRTLLEAVGTHIIGQPLAFFLIFPLFKFFGCVTFAPIPPLFDCFLQFVCISIITDAIHYLLHRSAHHPLLYRFHKQHHEYKRTIGIASEYSSLFEALTVNFIPVFIGPMLLGAHISLWLGWVALRTYESTEAHTGYDLPLIGFNSARFHDYHHSQNIGNFGIGEFWDCIFRTNLSYLRHLHKIKNNK